MTDLLRKVTLPPSLARSDRVPRLCSPARSSVESSLPSRGARASALLLLQVRSGLSRQEVDAAMRECQDLLTILCFTGSTLLLLSLDRHFLTC